MALYEWSGIPVERLNDKLTRQLINTERLTVARLELRKGAFVPEHRHENEQVSMIVEGALKFVLDGEEIIVKAGQALAIPSQAPHSAEALEDTVAVDIFTPRREDWIRGDDAYLRG